MNDAVKWISRCGRRLLAQLSLFNNEDYVAVRVFPHLGKTIIGWGIHPAFRFWLDLPRGLSAGIVSHDVKSRKGHLSGDVSAKVKHIRKRDDLKRSATIQWVQIKGPVPSSMSYAIAGFRPFAFMENLNGIQ
ncbi:hypothetical protein J1614_005372 [Plenodomus biglobosus]|nr:hypothetical protein J1614_005372 [Plenodomus biglobosus]